MCCELLARVLAKLVRLASISIFFKEVDGFNVHKIPTKGAVIFVCAPHASQFIDPLVVSSHVERPIGFLAAKSSCDKPYIGTLIKAMGSIPVKRPQDYKQPATGTITTSADGLRVLGSGTAFRSEFADGASIYIKATKRTERVAEVVSNVELVLKRATVVVEPPGSAIQIVPRIEQHEVYEQVFAELAAGRCVGIFPEGGSHDRTELLPLKAGVTIMALGAKAAHPGLDLVILPVGLNYFRAHRFRSHAYVDFGTPISIDDALVEQYKRGGPDKRAACGTLLDEIQEGLSEVTVQSPSWELLQVLRMVRRLYQPRDRQLTVSEKLELQRRFAEGYRRYKDNEKVKELVQDVNSYRNELKTRRVRDHQVQTSVERNCCSAFFLFFWRLLKFVVMMAMALPGSIVYGPVALLAQSQANTKAVAAQRSSSVKIRGRDVVATWKVMIALVFMPLFTVIYSAIITVMLKLFVLDDLAFWVYIVIAVALLFVLPWLGYVAVRFTETSVQMLLSLQPLLWTMCRCCAPATTLAEQRAAIKGKIKEIVGLFAHEVVGDREFVIPIEENEALVNADQVGSERPEADEETINE